MAQIPSQPPLGDLPGGLGSVAMREEQSATGLGARRPRPAAKELQAGSTFLARGADRQGPAPAL